MTLRGKKNHLSVLLFLAIFGALLTIATIYDLEVSRIMTHYSLKKGEYYTHNVFANFFEAVGMLPCYLLRAFATISVGWLFYKSLPQKALRVIALIVAACVATHLLSGAFRDMIFYPMRHMIAEDPDGAISAISALTPTVYLISYVLSAAVIGVSLLLTRKVSLDVWRRLSFFALGFFLVDLLSNTVVSGLKTYVDRVRFRSMNSVYGQALGGFDLHTRWYQVTDHADLLRATPLINYTDAFRSFPSGHTESAALSYSLILLIDCLHIEKKSVKVALWTAPILWTGLTAMGRIVAGAHFMSDVLFGGTIPFVLVILYRELFLRRSEGIKDMYPFLFRRKKGKVVAIS